jgi:hypothetical protein
MSKFSGFRKFRAGATLPEIISYLQTGLALSFSEIQSGLQYLSFSDNFESFEATVTIPPNQEIQIPNKMGLVPSKRLIVRSNSSSIVDGDTPWTSDFVSMKTLT